MKGKPRFWFLLACSAFMAIGLFLTACDGDMEPSSEQDTEADILVALRENYEERDSHQYPGLLADDFRFYLHPRTMEQEHLPEFWDRASDSLHTALLFSSPELISLNLDLAFDPHAYPDPDKQRQTTIDAFAYLELEIITNHQTGETAVLRLRGQAQRFLFRRGRTEADTLAASPTANTFYLVEWRDLGSSPLQILFTTWSDIKNLVRPAGRVFRER
jgi:hypothetical protein